MNTEVRTNVPFGNNELLSPSGIELLEEADLHADEVVTDAGVRLEEATPLDEVKETIVEQVAETLPDTLDADPQAIERSLRRQRVMALTALENSKKRRLPMRSLAIQHPRRQY